MTPPSKGYKALLYFQVPVWLQGLVDARLFSKKILCYKIQVKFWIPISFFVGQLRLPAEYRRSGHLSYTLVRPFTSSKIPIITDNRGAEQQIYCAMKLYTGDLKILCTAAPVDHVRLDSKFCLKSPWPLLCLCMRALTLGRLGVYCFRTLLNFWIVRNKNGW